MRQSLNREFFEAYKRFLLRDDIAILGGNDNDGEHHPLTGQTTDVTPNGFYDRARSDIVARRDGEVWVLFDRKNGTKIRMTFGKELPEYSKSQAPELVDVKLTDLCPYGCDYCYQGSTPKGEHARKDAVERLCLALGETQVFEVAIGGGEPTLHPDFVSTLERLRGWGVVPNFTTRNLTWLHVPETRRRVLDACGAFAISVDGHNVSNTLQQLRALCDLYSIDSQRINVQAVEGTVNYYSLFTAARHCNFRVTLLGYKTNGRGAKAQKSLLYGSDSWVATLKDLWDKNQGVCLGIDTMLAQKYEAQLKEMKISPKLYEKDEGKFSMYIDAVSMRAGPSSYCDPALMVDIQPKKESILEAFRKW